MKIIHSSWALFVAMAAVDVHGQEGPQHFLRATGRRLTTTTTTTTTASEATPPLPSFVKRALQSIFTFSALFNDTIETTTPTDPPLVTYQGAGTGAWGVQANRTFPAEQNGSSMQEQDVVMPRGGTGATSPKGYSLVEDRPRCYFTLGSNYCPAAPNNIWTNSYVSYLERTSQVLANAARMDPAAFQRIYNGNNRDTYKCTTRALPPLRYSANAQQAAVKASQILADPNCPFQHDTCRSYCGLYGGSCSWDARIGTYEPDWRGMGENIAMTTNAGQKEPTTAVLQWLASAPHCANIYSTSFTHIGVGGWGRYWTQNFLRMPSSTDNPLYDGTHYSHSTHTNGKLRFLVSFKSSAAPQSMKVVVNGVERPMSLHLGRATQGLYSFEQANPGTTIGCLSYHFFVRTSTGSTYRMPETGDFQTATVGSCTSNWVFSSNTAHPCTDAWAQTHPCPHPHTHTTSC
ncbi:wsc domain-containing protein [Nannochloropsis oceanica]